MFESLQSRISNAVKDICCSFFESSWQKKNVNYFRKKAPSENFSRVPNASLATYRYIVH